METVPKYFHQTFTAHNFPEVLTALFYRRPCQPSSTALYPSRSATTLRSVRMLPWTRLIATFIRYNTLELKMAFCCELFVSWRASFPRKTGRFEISLSGSNFVLIFITNDTCKWLMERDTNRTYDRSGIQKIHCTSRNSEKKRQSLLHANSEPIASSVKRDGHDCRMTTNRLEGA